MIKLPMKLLAGAALATTLLAGCGGDSGGNGPATPPPPPMQQTITDVVGYIRNLFNTTTANSEPVGINNLNLVGNDKTEPAATN